MTGLIIFIVAVVIVIGYIIYRNYKRKNTPIEETDLPIPVNPGGDPIYEINEFVGEANPSQGKAETACDVQHTRLYYVHGMDSRTLITQGDTLYNAYPSEATNGGSKWIGLENIANGEKNVVRVGTNGTILEVYPC